MTLHNIPEGLAVGIAIASVKTNLVPALILSIGIRLKTFLKAGPFLYLYMKVVYHVLKQ